MKKISTKSIIIIIFIIVFIISLVLFFRHKGKNPKNPKNPSIIPMEKGPYQYLTKSDALSACKNSNYSRLCSKQEAITYFSNKCTCGWTDNQEQPGYYMTDHVKDGHCGPDPKGGRWNSCTAGKKADAFCCL
jgi:hypothetical protein